MQRFRGIGCCRTKSVVSHRQPGDEKSGKSRQYECPKAQIYLVGEVPQPRMHGIVTDRSANNVCKQDQLREVLRQQQDHVRYRGAEDLPDADLAGPLFSHEGSKAQKPQTGDQYGEHRACDEYGTQPVFGKVQLLEVLIVEYTPYNALRLTKYVISYMIRSFKDRETEQLYRRIRSLKLPGDIQQTAVRKLRMLNRSTKLDDLRVPPANRLEKLSGDRAGQYSIRINTQWRVCFTWRNGDAYNVEIVDYH